MAAVLKVLSNAGGPGREGHVRFHLGIADDAHRIAVDAFRHREGGFTLVAVDSTFSSIIARRMGSLESKHPEVIKGSLVIPTPNQAHGEGCRIFGVHILNSFHDYQPHMQGLHRQLYEKGKGRPAPLLSGPQWKQTSGNTHFLENEKDSFGVLPGKFFKHMQVRKPRPGGWIQAKCPLVAPIYILKQTPSLKSCA
jgi:hypothetical protein